MTTATPGYLVISDVWYPGWRAEIDGAAAPVLRANYAFRAVPVPAGTHRVRLSFAPLTWKIGVAISATVFLLTVLIAGLHMRTGEAGRIQGALADEPALRFASSQPTSIEDHTQ